MVPAETGVKRGFERLQECHFWVLHGTTKPPAEPLSLARVVLWIAKLGGYFARKHDRPPWPTVVWCGFLTLHEVTAMYRIFRQNE
ncbi:hypothetical protein [Burkholderia pyrrocinia]|uniref:Transposase n=1 Tax=Burkholderia pyrrocinia TaxID=60550 RepID=A0ABZ3BYV7_BURPY